MTSPFTEKPKKVIPNPEPEPSKCQHVRILDVDKSVQRVFYECYHCKQALLSECTGKPTMEEFKGRQQEQQTPVKCPNCQRTAIKLITGKVLSTIEIPSPWAEEEIVSAN